MTPETVPYWPIPQIWAGSTVVILGGGPSLSSAQIALVLAAAAAPNGVKCMAINNAYLLAPWADLLWFCDGRHGWWGRHEQRPEYRAFKGLIATLDNRRLHPFDERLLHVENLGPRGGYSDAGGIYNGFNSGYQAIHVAARAGAKRILLLGYDMKKSGERANWHTDHPKQTSGHAYETWRKEFPALARALKFRVEIRNCTPGSALTAFPMAKLEHELAA